MILKNSPVPGFVVAGTHSSVGKTSVTLALLRLLRNKRVPVQPFKAGPDYIDPGHHKQAAGVPSYNLDSWMCTRTYLKNLFADVMQPGSLAVVEGVMGLFDGAYPTNDRGTTADIAKLFNLPVMLVIDGSQMARSAAALVDGFTKFDPDLKFLGVIANRVSSPKHANLIKAALRYHTDIPYLGNIPTNPSLSISERHLGLHQGLEQTDQRYNDWAEHIDKHIDIKKLLRKTGFKKEIKTTVTTSLKRWKKNSTRTFKVGIARDEAFQFCYQDTLDLIKHHSGSISFFSPLKDKKLPEDLDWLYFPGGYPELFAKKLSKNSKIIKCIQEFAKTRGVLAECGGLMYTGKAIIDSNGVKHPILGLLNLTTSMKPSGLTIGYRDLKQVQSKLPTKIIKLKGHEFHFSNFKSNREPPVFSQKTRKNCEPITDGYIKNRTLALYSHIYWGSSPETFRALVEWMRGTH
ncbi:MAG: cobyrinate a,c-diamide synthase [Candidatus Nitronauta litoralis]|uniref:Cobyrinate a,c-diamide synthase n=1 Tax=Candidatus Nitronauta litoralis TaxID=2705533 RepID=A0A7T0BY23_9BACT|nr:MAG: cobyrinate a,c-diamide synthase [Candidatus Nitronauta litoralis]